MKIVCIVCGKVIGSYENKKDDVSHGICRECFEKRKKKKGDKK